MALEAFVYPQDPFSYISCKNFPFPNLYFQEEEDQDPQDIKNTIKLGQEQGQGFSSTNCYSKSGDNSDDDCREDQNNLPYGSTIHTENQPLPLDVAARGGKRKRRKTKSSKSNKEIENQRMTHIAVERNRRKQMNEYLAVLRSLMPPSYAERGDQASIVGGAINYLKELEHHLQSLESPVKTTVEETGAACDQSNTISTRPFSDFFTFPQYSSQPSLAAAEGMAEIEVTMAESHASMKILAKKQPRQLLKLVSSIHNLKLTILHLNVTSRENYVLYSLNVKVEEGCQLNTGEDIAAAVNQILRRIEEESSFS